ncbi:unnamed protein product [Paramecium pentaurelia]|uniref:Uncharacterized protein n=1 Tax=Paramecium pentaurelia TaxID=43138 RepID=A0A8S1XMZ5_9CILI|nr:unnamed protein product [Paramecium pentaurelia]
MYEAHFETVEYLDQNQKKCQGVMNFFQNILNETTFRKKQQSLDKKVTKFFQFKFKKGTISVTQQIGWS